MTSGGGMGGEGQVDVLWTDVRASFNERSFREVEQQIEASTGAAGTKGGNALKGAMGSAMAALPGMALAVAAAVGAALVGGVKTAFDIAAQARQGVRDMQAELGLTGQEAQRLGEVAKTVFGNNWGGSLAEAQEAVKNVRREVQGLTDEELGSVAEGSLAIAERFKEDQSKVAAAVQSVMKATGASAQEALDFITAGFQRGLNSSGDFLDTLNEYGPQFEKGKTSASELFSLLETGAAKGALGTDKIADAYKEFGFSLADTSEGMTAAFAQLGIDQEELTKKIDSGAMTQTQAFQLVMDRLKGVTSETERMAIISQVFKGAGEDLGKVTLQIDTTKTKMAELGGSNQQVKDSFNSLSSVFQTAWRQVQLQLQPVGDLLLDLANEAMPTVKRAIDQLGPFVTAFVRQLVEGFQRGRETVSELAPVFQQGMNTIRPLLSSLSSLFESVFNLAATLWQTVLKPTLEAIAPYVGIVMDTLGRTVKVAIDFVTNIVNALAALLRGDWSKAWEFLAGAVVGALDGIEKTVKNYYEKMLTWGRDLGGRIVEGFRSGLDGLQGVFQLALSNALNKVADSLPGMMGDLFRKAAQASEEAARANFQTSAQHASNTTNGARASTYTTPPMSDDPKNYTYGYISKLKDVFQNDPKVASDCASIASSIMRNLGQSINTSANAGVLEQNAKKAGYQRVEGDEIKPGDLIVWTSGNGKTYGAVSGKHVGVAAGYQNGKLMVINNPGNSNTVVEPMFDRQNAVAYRAPQSPYAQPIVDRPKTELPVSEIISRIQKMIEQMQSKRADGTLPDKQLIATVQALLGEVDKAFKRTNDPTQRNVLTGLRDELGKMTPATIPLKLALDPKDLKAEIDAKVKDVQARLQLKLINKDEAIRELKVIEDGAISLGRKGGPNLQAYADGAKAARSAIDGLKQGQKESVDVLASLERQYEYAGKTGLPAYVSGLKAYIAQQEKVASSAREGSKAQTDAMDNVIRARGQLESVTKKANETDLEREQRQAREVLAQEALTKAIENATDQRLQAIVKEGVTATNSYDKWSAARAELARREEASGKTAQQTALEREQASRKEALAQAALEKAIRNASEARLKDIIAGGVQKEGDLARINAAEKELERRGQLDERARQQAKDARAKAAQEAEADRKAQAEAEGRAYAETLRSTIANIQNESDEGLVRLYTQASARRDSQLIEAVYDEWERRARVNESIQAQIDQDLAAGTYDSVADGARKMTPPMQAYQAVLEDVLPLLPGNADEWDAFLKVMEELDSKGNLAAGVMVALRQQVKNLKDEMAYQDWLKKEGYTTGQDVTYSWGIGSGVSAADRQKAQQETADNLMQTLLGLDDATLQSADALKIYETMLDNTAKQGGITQAQLEELRDTLRLLKGETQDFDQYASVTDGARGVKAVAGNDYTRQLAYSTELAQRLREEFAGLELGSQALADKTALWNTLLAGSVTTGAISETQHKTLLALIGQIIQGKEKQAQVDKDTAEKAAADGKLLDDAWGQYRQQTGRAAQGNGELIKSLEALRGKAHVNQAELEKLISLLKQLDAQAAQQQGMEKAISTLNTWGNYAKQLAGPVTQMFAMMAGASGETADAWAQDMGNMVNDLVSLGTAIAKGDWAAAAVQVLTTIANWFVRNKKAAEEAAKAVQDYNNQFKFTADGYNTMTQTKTTTGFLFWTTDHYKNEIDTMKRDVALALEGGFVDGITNGFQAALAANDFSVFEKNLEKSVGQAVLKGLIESFMQQELLKNKIGPAIAQYLKDGNADALKAAVRGATDQARDFYENVLRPIAGEFGLLGEGQQGPQQGSIAYLQEEIRKLQENLNLATTQAERDRIMAEIAVKQKELDAMTRRAQEEKRVAAGSIAALQEEISKLQQQFNETADAAERDRLRGEIKILQEKLRVLQEGPQAPVDPLAGAEAPRVQKVTIEMPRDLSATLNLDVLGTLSNSVMRLATSLPVVIDQFGGHVGTFGAQVDRIERALSPQQTNPALARP